MSKYRLLESCTVHGTEEISGEARRLMFGKGVILEVAELPAESFDLKMVRVKILTGVGGHPAGRAVYVSKAKADDWLSRNLAELAGPPETVRVKVLKPGHGHDPEDIISVLPEQVTFWTRQGLGELVQE